MKTRVSSVTPLELLAIIKNFNIVCKLFHWKAENLHLFIFSLLQTRTTKARLKLLQDFLKWCSEIIHIKAVEIFQFTSTECLRFSWSHFSLDHPWHCWYYTVSVTTLCGWGQHWDLGCFPRGSAHKEFTWDLCRMQKKTVAAALNPGMFLAKQAKKKKKIHEQLEASAIQ